MVGFSQSCATDGAATAEEKQDLKTERLLDSKTPSTPNDPLDVCLRELEDFSSFLDFDSIDGWFVEGDSGFCSGTNMSDLGLINGGVGDSNEGFEAADGICKDDGVERVLIGDQSGGNLGGLIEEQLEKVSLEGKSDCLVPNVASEKDEVNVGRTVSDSEESSSDEKSESEGSPSSSESSSSSSDDDGDDEEEEKEEKEEEEEEKEEEEDGSSRKGKKKEQKETNIEEGEIVLSDVDDMVGWGEDAEDDGPLGPIKSKNEILPPVPAVTISLEPHHQTLPVGIILSIVGVQVIVEGVEQHNPLSEGSILWITESRLPLGIVDEIFGPVKNPYYIVRYNSETELPAGIQQGTPISFVPEFSDHILNDRSLYQKGYDASGENDEELLNEMEFSDDEKEAEYKRMLKTKKRGTNESKPENRRNENKRKDKRQLKNQAGNWNRNQNPAAFEDKPPVTEDQHPVPPFATSSGVGQNMVGNQNPMVPPFWPGAQAPAPGFSAPNGIWNGGFQLQHPSSMGLPSGPPPNGLPWIQQNQPSQLLQGPLQTGMPFPHQIGTFPRFPVNFNPFGGQPNFGAGPALGPWPTCADQNILNALQFGMGLQAPQASLPQSAGGEQVIQPLVFQTDTSAQTSSANSGKPLNFNQGRGGGGGRRGQHRGRGRFGARRGRHQSR